MLLNIKCKAISSVRVVLEFDDGSVKDELIAIGDLIDVKYNGNGMRKHIIGRVTTISTVGADPKNWYIIVDGSDDFAKNGARFSPASILDVEVLRKDAQDTQVKTPIGQYSCPYLRVVKGRLEYSIDGYEWHRIRINNEDIIEPQEGTVPIHHGCSPIAPPNEDDDIEDAVY